MFLLLKLFVLTHVKFIDTCLVGIIDGGSSGTRLNIFNITNGRIKSVMVFRRDKGISTIKLENIGSYMENLIVSSQVSKNTPIIFNGTAGLRRLKKKKQDRILREISKGLSDYNLIENQIIEGYNEAYYMLKSFKYAAPMIKEFILIDMGGKSVQIINKEFQKYKLKSYEIGISDFDCLSDDLSKNENVNLDKFVIKNLVSSIYTNLLNSIFNKNHNIYNQNANNQINNLIGLKYYNNDHKVNSMLLSKTYNPNNTENPIVSRKFYDSIRENVFINKRNHISVSKISNQTNKNVTTNKMAYIKNIINSIYKNLLNLKQNNLTKLQTNQNFHNHQYINTDNYKCAFPSCYFSINNGLTKENDNFQSLNYSQNLNNDSYNQSQNNNFQSLNYAQNLNNDSCNQSQNNNFQSLNYAQNLNNDSCNQSKKIFDQITPIRDIKFDKPVFLLSVFHDIFRTKQISIANESPVICSDINLYNCKKKKFLFNFLKKLGFSDFQNFNVIKHLNNIDITWAYGKALEFCINNN